MAGHVTSLYLRDKGYNVSTVASTHQLDASTELIDVTNTEKISRYLSDHSFDVVINCIGLLIQQSDKRPDLAVALNSYFPRFLEHFYANTNTKVVHLSTDCVFSGKNAPYEESSFKDGDTHYDRSKALGEIINDKDLTFRMSIIGPEVREKGTGLVHWFFNQQGNISGYTRVIWNGITTIELAKALDRAIEQDLTGLYHLVPSENISKFSLLALIKDVFKISNIELTQSAELVSDKTLINTRTDFDFTVLGYPQMLEEMKEWMLDHEDIYSHYGIK